MDAGQPSRSTYPSGVAVDGVNPVVGINALVGHFTLVTGTFAAEGVGLIQGVTVQLSEPKYGSS